jgi:kynurenine formamidase
MLTRDEFLQTARSVSNWGRWGNDDQLGTLNYITASDRAAAAALARQGKVFSLAISIDADGVWPGNFFRRNPIHLMTIDGGDGAQLAEFLTGWGGSQESYLAALWDRGLLRFNDDYIMMPLQAATQWDALAHVYYEDKMYNGFPSSAVTSLGATKNSIDQVAHLGVVGRGVLLDVARFRGSTHLEAGSIVEPSELQKVVDAQAVDVRRGDILLVRTGWWSRFAVMGDAAAWRAGCPGLSWRCAAWLHQLEVAAVAADNVAVEAGGQSDEIALPLHLLCLRDMGMMLGELWDLDKLAADCAADGIYEFLLVAAPLTIRGAVGSPINPIAVK